MGRGGIHKYVSSLVGSLLYGIFKFLIILKSFPLTCCVENTTVIISKYLESCSITVELLTQQYFVVAIVILLFVSLIFLVYLLACVCFFLRTLL